MPLRRYYTAHLNAIGSLDATTQGSAQVEAALHVPTKEFAERLMGFQEEPSECVCACDPALRARGSLRWWCASGRRGTLALARGACG